MSILRCSKFVGTLDSRQLCCDFTEATMPVATRRDTCMRLALFQRVWIEICFSMWICECECVRMFDHLLKQWFLYARSHVCDTECAHKGETNTDRSSFCEATGCKPWSSNFADRASHWKFRLHPVHLPLTWKGWPAPINGDALLEKSNEKGFNSRLDRLVIGRCWSMLSS